MIDSEELQVGATDFLDRRAESLLRSMALSEDRKQEIRNVVPEYKKIATTELGKAGVDLVSLEADGYTPFFGRMLGECFVTVGTNRKDAFLLVKKVNKDGEIDDDKRYIVKGGRVQRDLYYDWEEQIGEDKVDNGGWVLIDKRSGSEVKQQATRPLPPPEMGSSFIPVRIDGVEFSSPYQDYGGGISTGYREPISAWGKSTKMFKWDTYGYKLK